MVPLATICHFISSERALTLSFVHFYLPLIVGAILFDEEGIPALGRSFFEAALVDGAIVIDKPATAMR